MAKKIKQVAAKRSRGKKQAEIPQANFAPVELSRDGLPLKWLFVGGLVLILGIFFLQHRRASSTSSVPQAVQAALPPWGQALKLETVSKFDEPETLMDMKADADGNVYLLTGSSIYKYTNGKRVKRIDFGGSSNLRRMAFDGSYFYVTDFDSPAIVKVDKDLSKMVSIAIPGAFRLLGAAYASHALYLEECDQTYVFILDSNVKKLGYLGTPKRLFTQLGFIQDLQIDSSGVIYQCDQIHGKILRYGANHKALSPLQAPPWGAASWERMAIVGGRIYINCFNDQRVTVMSTSGKPLGFMMKDSPQMITLGDDGFIYLRTGNSIEKIKPLVGPIPESVAPVASPAKP